MKYMLALLLFFSTTAFGQQIAYTDGNNNWNADSLGNQRFVITLSSNEYHKNRNVAHVIIPWRRRDDNIAEKRIVVIDAKNQRRVTNVKLVKADNEMGELLFEPVSGAGDYYVYYLLYRNTASPNYPKGIYLKPDTTADDAWLKKTYLRMAYGQAITKAHETINTFNSFYPMEIIATKAETNRIIKYNTGKAFVVFPEDRLHPIKMPDYLPQRWVQSNNDKLFTDTASKGENFSFQLGIYTLRDLKNLQIRFSDLQTTSGEIIEAQNISCLNTNGIDYKGNPLVKTVDVPAQTVEPMWCLIDIPVTATPGKYNGSVTIITDGNETQTVNYFIYVDDKTVQDGGISEPQKQTRLKWLNSTLAQENTVIAPYTDLKIEDTTISFLGRKLIIAADGLPAQIQTFFTPEMTALTDKPNNILTEPIHFHMALSGNDKNIEWQHSGIKYLKKDAGTVSWQVVNTSPFLQMQVNASLEFDGFLAYTVKLIALQDVDFSDINFHIPVAPQFAKYFMGLGLKGSTRPDSVLWKWDVTHKNQDGGWIGAVNAGIQFSLRDEHYVRPLNTNFYLQKPLLLPNSWGNGDKGGIDIYKKGSAVLLNAYSGARQMKKGDTLYYNFNLLITPFHTINTDFQWQTRFYHKYDNPDSIKAKGATVVNIHHATPINPYINYPFIEWEKMKNYIDSAHALGLKVKIYNTVRELSNRAYETFPMRSLGHEIYSTGPGGGFSWLQEHIGKDYIAAWFVPEIKDAAIVNSGMSRWHNYYVEGMNWLVNNVGIDGIYLDDVAFDRITMKRIKRVLTQNGHPGIIDLHSANQYNERDGYNNSANLYMEHFPYLNRLWFGEYFDYEHNNPDFFLTEVSGIPFGLMGEMLQDGGNPWRGMIYGMTNRMPWSDNADPRPIWKLWDDFGMEGSKMIGYWSDNCPVQTGNNKVLATVYKKKGSALVSIASWADDDVTITPVIKWKALGIDPATATITSPAVKNFQPQKIFKPGETIPVEKGKGWLLIIK